MAMIMKRSFGSVDGNYQGSDTGLQVAVVVELRHRAVLVRILDRGNVSQPHALSAIPGAAHRLLAGPQLDPRRHRGALGAAAHRQLEGLKAERPVAGRPVDRVRLARPHRPELPGVVRPAAAVAAP